MAKIGKRLKAANATVEALREYSLTEAVALAKANAKAKFDETIDVSIKLGVDTRQADQNIRGMLLLPHGTGKTIRVAVFARGDKAEQAKAAGADRVGAEDLAELIEAGTVDFDRCIATPDLMPLVGRLGKILGPKGIMPNPKLGTVTMDVTKAVTEAKSGAIEYRAEKNGIIHAGVGKASFDAKKIEENIQALLVALQRAKPQTSKGIYFQKASVSSTMGPGVRLALSETVAALGTTPTKAA